MNLDKYSYLFQSFGCINSKIYAKNYGWYYTQSISSSHILYSHSKPQIPDEKKKQRNSLHLHFNLEFITSFNNVNTKSKYRWHIQKKFNFILLFEWIHYSNVFSWCIQLNGEKYHFPKLKLEICWILLDTSVSNACSTKSQCDNCIESSARQTKRWLLPPQSPHFHMGSIYSVDIVPTCQSLL